jgi:hypothetical protein
VSVAPISIVVPAYGPVGNPYSQFVLRWWAAVAAMRPAPAKVVVVHSDPEPLGLLASATHGIAVRNVAVQSDHIADYCNAGAEAASQTWISTIGVDDAYEPDALVDLAQADASGAGVMAWHQREVGSHVWQCFWDPQTLRHANTLPGSSPFRRDLWQRVGGIPRLGWCDWAFWLRCAAAGATAFQSDRVGVNWDPGHGHATWSGQRMPPEHKASRDAEIRGFVEGLRL